MSDCVGAHPTAIFAKLNHSSVAIGRSQYTNDTQVSSGGTKMDNSLHRRGSEPFQFRLLHFEKSAAVQLVAVGLDIRCVTMKLEVNGTNRTDHVWTVDMEYLARSSTTTSTLYICTYTRRSVCNKSQHAEKCTLSELLAHVEHHFWVLQFTRKIPHGMGN